MKKNSLFLVIIITPTLLLQGSLLIGVDWFQFSRSEINNGQWWRFITANFIHLNWRHLVLNLIAMTAIVYIYPRLLLLREQLLLLLLCGLSVTIGIWLLRPSIYWYVGLSGALHGLLVALVIIDLFKSKSILSVSLFFILVLKLYWEIKMGPMPGSEHTIRGKVIVDAHLFGSIGGLMLATIFIFKKHIKYKKIST